MKTSAKFLLPAVLLAAILAGCVTVQKWEYRTRTVKERIGRTVLDQYGRGGWELVQVIRVEVADTNSLSATNLDYEYIFKRPLK